MPERSHSRAKKKLSIEEVEGPIEEVEGRIRRIYDGHLRLRREPSMADNVICGVTNFEVKRVLRKADGKDTFFQTHEGYWVTGDPELVEFMTE